MVKKNNNLDDVVTLNDNSNALTAKENVSSINNEEDLYAPFGDKTFSKDKLLDSNTDNNVENSDTSVDNNNDNNTVLDFTGEVNLDKIKSDNEFVGHIDYDVIKEHIKQKKTPEEQNDFDLQMIKKYMGKNYALYTTTKFNPLAALFGSIYLIYRKIYSCGILMYMIGVILLTFFIYNSMIIGIASTAVILLLLHILIGSKFNKLYLNHSYNKIKQIENIYNANRDEFVLVKCKQYGRGSIAKTIIITSLLAALIIVGVIQVSDLIK